jgi:hypothetical protein
LVSSKCSIVYMRPHFACGNWQSITTHAPRHQCMHTYTHKQKPTLAMLTWDTNDLCDDNHTRPNAHRCAHTHHRRHIATASKDAHSSQHNRYTRTRETFMQICYDTSRLGCTRQGRGQVHTHTHTHIQHLALVTFCSIMVLVGLYNICAFCRLCRGSGLSLHMRTTFKCHSNLSLHMKYTLACR